MVTLHGERLKVQMEPVLLVVKKIPPLALTLFIFESFNVFSAQLDEHILARITGACCGGAAMWFHRKELVSSRRVACLMFAWGGGVGFSPLVDWVLYTRLTSLPKVPALVFGSAFFVSVVCVRLLEQLADNPLGVVQRWLLFIRGTKDKTDA
jgi:hypothetical protein